jgi:hypothetical protein
MSFEAYARRQARGLFDKLTDRLVQELSIAAREEAEAAATEARKVGEEAARIAEGALAEAQAELAAVRTEGEARLAAAQAMNAGLLETVEAGRHEVLAAKATAQADLERTRRELEARIGQLEQEQVRALEARDEALAEREAEARRAQELADRLELESRRLGELDAALEATRHDRETVVERTRAAIRAIDRAGTPSEILDALLETLVHDFGRAAVLMASTSGLKGWRARGPGIPDDIASLVIPRAGDSLPARAVTEGRGVTILANGGPTPAGLWGMPVARAVALPVLAGDRVIAVVYAEDSKDGASSEKGSAIAEMLIEHASLRLTTKAQATAKSADSPASSRYSPARQARRLKIREQVDLTVDGAESALVDLSTNGAQILSPIAMRPNRVLRMMLRAGHDDLACKGRVMWARFEQPRGAAAHYRVGVKFTDVDTRTIDRFLAGHGVAEATG